MSVFCWKPYKGKLTPNTRFIVLTEYSDGNRAVSISKTNAGGEFPKYVNCRVLKYDANSPKLRSPDEYLAGVAGGLRLLKKYAADHIKQIL